MFGHSSQDSAPDAAADGAAATLARSADKSAARAAAKAAKAESKGARKTASAQRKTAKASAKAAQAATKASEAEAALKATKPARLVDRLTDPKTAKRALSVGKVLAPALAPYAIKAAVSTRGFLDQQRAHRLGVSVADVAQFRGPTGPTGARISGLQRSMAELAARKDNELQVTRFVEVSRARLTDLTTAVQASASMPRPRRARVLRAINRELDRISGDLMTHLVGSSAA
jgi:hypothetical protein